VRYLNASLVVAALAAAFAPIPAPVVERLYSQGLYAWFQPGVTRASSLVPVALLDVAILALLALMITVFARRWRAHGFLQAARRGVVSLVVLAAVIYLWFLAFWGLNYRRVPLEDKLAYDAATVTRERATALARTAIAEANALTGRAGHDDEEALRAAFLEVQRRLGATRTTAVAAPKPSIVGWYFRHAAIDGLTNPFFLEIILHPDLLPFERPFVLAHEWAHLAGYADEAEANFVAWLTCVRATPGARYSGWLVAYQHLAAHLPRETRLALRAELSPGVVGDLNAASRRVARATPAVRTAARRTYDAYLRANRVDEGIASYGLVVRLMLGTDLEPDWIPILQR
jgi:hypothetical protein